MECDVPDGMGWSSENHLRLEAPTPRSGNKKSCWVFNGISEKIRDRETGVEFKMELTAGSDESARSTRGHHTIVPRNQ